jgi:hypothetical protein
MGISSGKPTFDRNGFKASATAAAENSRTGGAEMSVDDAGAAIICPPDFA